jgi:DNA repair exonuclease SbcCD ATPase subunit
MTDQRARQLASSLRATRREMDLEPDHLALVLDEALRLHNKPGLQAIQDDDRKGWAYWLRELPNNWRNARGSIYDEKGRMLAVSFDHNKAARRTDVALIHLNHPIMKHALATFRGNLWGDQFRRDQTLHRASYRIVADASLNEPVVIVWGRLLVTNDLSQKIHEELVLSGGKIHRNEIIPYSQAELQKLIKIPYEHPKISVEIGQRLRSLFPAHKKQLLEMLCQREKKEKKQISELAQQCAQQESEQLRELINERIKELRARIRAQDAKVSDYQQELFDRDEFLQYQEDMAWLKRKLDDLKDRRKEEPKSVKMRYKIRESRIFPLALLYMIPKKLVK